MSLMVIKNWHVLVVGPSHFNWEILWSNFLTISIFVLEDFQARKNYNYSTKMVMFLNFFLGQRSMLPWKCNHVPNESLSSLWEHVGISNTFLGECSIISQGTHACKEVQHNHVLRGWLCFPRKLFPLNVLNCLWGLCFPRLCFFLNASP